jgi:regulator of cell morphogenesis and NO signaling
MDVRSVPSTVITESTSVAEIAAAMPASVRVFQRHGIDFCCGGKKPLGLVCEEQGLSFSEVTNAIEQAAVVAIAEPQDWTRAPLHVLVDHIVSTYHDVLREELPRLETMAARVLRVHGPREPRVLGRIEAIVAELSSDLNEHMRKEELVLFPMIRAIEEKSATGGLRISAPIRVMEWEHDRAGELLAKLKSITSGFDAPRWACETVRALYRGLEELEGSMHMHVHLENNVLFSRAVRLEAEAA